MDAGVLREIEASQIAGGIGVLNREDEVIGGEGIVFCKQPDPCNLYNPNASKFSDIKISHRSQTWIWIMG